MYATATESSVTSSLSVFVARSICPTRCSKRLYMACLVRSGSILRSDNSMAWAADSTSVQSTSPRAPQRVLGLCLLLLSHPPLSLDAAADSGVALPATFCQQRRMVRMLCQHNTTIALRAYLEIEAAAMTCRFVHAKLFQDFAGVPPPSVTESIVTRSVRQDFV